MYVNGISTEIEIIRSSRKSIAAEVRPGGKVIVRAPNRMPEARIIAFLQEKAEAIEKYVQKQLKQNEALSTLPPFSAEELQSMAQEALREIPPRVAYYAKLLGVTYGRITIRNQKTRWGSCTAKGNLNFNCLLMRTPPEVRDSVIVHELCHRIHLNHSPAFYAECKRVFPDYDRCDRWLKEEGTLLIRRMTGE